jgi:hypothetical protein
MSSRAEQDQVELGAPYLVGVRKYLVDRVGELERHRLAVPGRHELGAKL